MGVYADGRELSISSKIYHTVRRLESIQLLSTISLLIRDGCVEFECANE